MKYRFFLVTLFLICFAFRSFSQHSVSGKVLDSVTGTPLAFVNIIINNGVNGITTDIDGNFVLKSASQIHQLRLSYVGYQSRTIKVENETRNLVITLLRKEIELKGVDIFPVENPAHRIIRKVIANREANDPEKIPAFKYKSYNKLSAEYYLDKSKYAINSDPESKVKDDSTFLRLRRLSEQQYIMMMESNTERIYLHGRSQESVLGTRVSGFSDPNFSSLATDIQPFSFYKDFISLTITDVKDYLNPIANGSIGRYHYQLEDTLYDNRDTVFVISFYPERGKNFNGLKGVLYINSNRYAIQSVIAEPAEAGLWSIKIQQMYAFANNRHWFPIQLNYDWVLPNYPSEKVGMVLHGRSYISDIDFDAAIKNSDFGPSNIIFQDGAGKHDSIYWTQHRKDTLTVKEMKTYRTIDSLGKKTNFDYISKAAEKILDGYLPLSVFDLGLEYLFQYNNIEGIRVGLGARTNERILRWASLGGYFGYGFWDKEWKYGGNLDFTLSKKHEVKLGFTYFKDLESPGTTNLYRYSNSSYWTDYLLDKIDRVEKISAQFRFRTFRYLQVSLSGNSEIHMPEYAYFYLPKGSDSTHTYHFTEVQLGLRYAYKEKLIDAFNQRFTMGTNYPVVYLTYIHGFNNLLGGMYRYDKVEGAIEKNFLIKHFGKTSLFGEAGVVLGSVPYAKLFKGKGSFSTSFTFYFRNSFQTMRVDEFLYDRYVMLFGSHNFGSNLFHIGNFKPELSLSQGVLYGTLKDAENHTGIDFKVPNNWYFESGLIIDNLVRLKLFNLAYLKVGIGGFYRYGYYAFENPLKNVALKLSLKISGSK